MLVEPDAGKATWVAASTYGTDTTTGEEVKGALKEIHFSRWPGSMHRDATRGGRQGIGRRLQSMPTRSMCSPRRHKSP